MLNKNLHRLLRRQLKKSDTDLSGNKAYADFLNKVDDAYKSFDKDIGHIENILEESLRELFIANQDLRNERDKTKNHLETILANVEGIIFQTDLEGNFTFLNQAWNEYTGYSIKDSLGRNFKDFLKEEYIQGDKSIKQLFSKKIEGLKFVFRYPKSEHEFFWFEVKFKLSKDINGEKVGYIGTIVDITNLKKTEIELQKASKAKDEFLSTMSHEIRTPLNAVTGLANILLMDAHLPDQIENLKALKYSGEHLLGLINDLLDFDKIKAGKLKLVEKDFSLYALLNNIEAHFKLRTKAKNLKFEIIKCPKTPDVIIGDQMKLTQVIKNLLSNSLKFTEEGSISLRVKNLNIDNNKVNLEFRVEDTGIGIPADKQESIFESFIQADSETSVKYGGTGLGLAISKKLLNLQGSDLIVKSEPNKGSIFSFAINYKISNRLSGYLPTMIEKQPTYQPIQLKVLVAEDNKMNVLILKKFFHNWEIDFRIANNGEELLEIYKQEDFDLILMDLQMPILNGYEATKEIRNLENKKKANVPIIALTAFAQTDIKIKTEQYKMNGFMSKPFKPSELYNLLHAYSVNANAVEK